MGLSNWARSIIPIRVKNWLSGGFIPPSWPMNFWQEGRTPITMGVNSVVEACVQTTAQSVAMAPIKHMRDTGDGGWKTTNDSRAAKVFRRPNDNQTRSDFMLNLVDSLLKEGNAYVYVGVRERSSIAPDEMHLLNPRMTRGYRISTGEVFYGVSADRWTTFSDMDMESVVPARDIAHFKLHTPNDALVGVSPIEAAAASIAANNAILANEATFFTNMSRPSGILSTTMSLNATQMNELAAAFEEKSKGAASGKVPVLGHGLTWQPLTITSHDAQLVESLKMTVEDISRVFRVPLSLINAMQGATFSNSEALINFWLATGLGFVLTHIELGFEKAFGLPVGERLNFDEKQLLRQDFVTRMDALGKAVVGGVYAPNEARAVEGLPAKAGGDEPRVQQQVVPLTFYDRQADREDAKLQLAVDNSKKPEPVLPSPPAPDVNEEAMVAQIEKAMAHAG